MVACAGRLPLYVAGRAVSAVRAIGECQRAGARLVCGRGFHGFFGGLGQYIITGIALRDYTEVLAGAILVTALALVVDGVFALVQRGVLSRVSPRTDRAFNATLIS